MSSALPRDAALSLLRWYAQMGVDVALAEEPVDRLAPASPLAASSLETHAAEVRESRAAENAGDETRGAVARRAAAVTAAVPTLLTTHPDAVVLAAREQAASAASLEALQAILERFEGCA